MVRGAKYWCGLLVAIASCTPKERTACNDTVSALLVVEKRCGNAASDDTIRTSLESQLTSGMGCGAVLRLRDENALRMECFPALAALSCAEYVTAGTPTGRSLPASCVNQLLLRPPDDDGGVDGGDAEAGTGDAGDAGDASSPVDASSTEGGTMDAAIGDAGPEAAAPDAAPDAVTEPAPEASIDATADAASDVGVMDAAVE